MWKMYGLPRIISACIEEGKEHLKLEERNVRKPRGRELTFDYLYEHLSKLHHILSLEIKGFDIDKFEWICPLTKLRTLEIFREHWVHNTDFSIFNEFEMLSELTLVRYAMKDLTRFLKNDKLKTLKLSTSSLENLDGIENISSLNKFTSEYGRIENYDRLINYENLDYIRIYGNLLSNIDISIFMNMPKLKQLDVRYSLRKFDVDVVRMKGIEKMKGRVIVKNNFGEEVEVTISIDDYERLVVSYLANNSYEGMLTL